MEITRIGTTPTYSQSVLHGNTVYLSGQVPWNTKGQSIRAQSTEVFSLVDAELQLAGTDKTKILSIQIFLLNPEDYAEMNVVFKEWMPAGSAPARNTICGVKFPNPQWSIEVVVVAAL